MIGPLQLKQNWILTQSFRVPLINLFVYPRYMEKPSLLTLTLFQSLSRSPQLRLLKMNLLKASQQSCPQLTRFAKMLKRCTGEVLNQNLWRMHLNLLKSVPIWEMRSLQGI